MGNGRSTVYNSIVTPEKLEQCNKENIALGNDFLEYLASIDRSKTTIEAYRHDLNIFWCVCHDLLGDKFFVNLSKRDIAKFQNYGINTLGWSPSRTRRVKSTISSLSNYIENMLDDEFENYKPIVRKIESPSNTTVREKTVYSEEQLQNILDKLVEKERYDLACMVSLAMNGGRRKAELTRFKVSYFNDENIIYGSLYKTPEKIKTKGRGSRGKLLTCYTLVKPFKPYLDMWLKKRQELGIESDWLFPNKVDGEYLNEPMPSEKVDTWANSINNLSEVPFYFHSLRHYFTTACSKSGLPDDVIKSLVGWQNLDMVMLYKDVTADEQFSKYFGEDGIKKVKTTSLTDL